MSDPHHALAISNGKNGSTWDAESARQAICTVTKEACLKTFGEKLEAILLTGSMGRREASFDFKEGRCKCLGDAEFMVVFKQKSELPSSLQVQQVRESIESKLVLSAIHCAVDLSPINRDYLQKLPPHVFSYELKHGSTIVWGNTEILDVIPNFSVTDLSKEDAWRLLCNRLLELFECADELTSGNEIISEQLEYKVAKLYLDMATSLLVFEGSYAPSYQLRREQLQQLAGQSPKQVLLGQDLSVFGLRVSECTDKKLGVSGSSTKHNFPFCAEAIRQARGLWRSELVILTGKTDSLSDAQLLDTWAKSQPFQQKIRGWLYIARAQGWHRSIRQWPKWLKMLWKGSPRYWIYSASCSLLFSLAEPASDQTVANFSASKSRTELPVLRSTAASGTPSSWQEFAKDVLWNYKTFLVGTRV